MKEKFNGKQIAAIINERGKKAISIKIYRKKNQANQGKVRTVIVLRHLLRTVVHIIP